MAYLAYLLNFGNSAMNNMPSGATATAIVSATLTSVNYATKGAENLSMSLLEYGFVILTTDGIELTLSLRDILFIVTALITIGAALRVHALKVRQKRRRKSDICRDDEDPYQ